MISYNYEFIDIINTEYNNDKYTEYIFKFKGIDEYYYVIITIFDKTNNDFTINFQLENDFITDRNENREYLTYSNSNKYEIFKVFKTIEKIIRYTIKNNKLLNSCTIYVKDYKRYNIYKYYINKYLLKWEIYLDEKIDNIWIIKYKF